jgi:hypothetical protein
MLMETNDCFPSPFERNLSLAIAFIVLGLIPTSRFMKSPRRSYLCGITAWAIFTATYSATELHFPGLAARLSLFHLFISRRCGPWPFGLFVLGHESRNRASPSTDQPPIVATQPISRNVAPATKSPIPIRPASFSGCGCHANPAACGFK